MRVEVVSPEQVLFSGEATMVITRTLGVGEIAFMANHAPFVAAIVECDTVVHLADDTVVHVATLGGFVEVSNNKVTILSDEAELADQIDVAAAHRERDEAEAELRSHADDEAAQRRLRRAEARLAAAGANRSGASAPAH
jgi:F-type H+-transporting ATPase subunit epsilon